MAITGTGQSDVEVAVGGDASQLNSALDSAVSNLNDFKTAVGVAGAALATLATKQLADAINAASDFEEQMAGIERVTDPETAERMGDAIQEMAARAPLAHEELSQIAESAGRLGVEGENLEEFTENVAMLATSTDLAANEAGDALARISTLMNIPIEDSEKLGSAINELANNFGTSASEITDAMTRAGGALDSLGVGEDEALGLAAAMNEVSPSARVAGTSLRNVAESLMSPSTVADVAETLGMTEEEFRNMRDEDPSEVIKLLATTMNDGGDQAEALREVLGKQASDLQSLGSNMDAVEGATAAAGGQFEEATALQEEFETASSTFNAQVQILRNRLQNVAITIGGQLLPHIADALSLVTDLVTWFADLNEKTDGLLGAVLLISTAIGGFVAAGAAAVSMVGGLSAVIAGLGVAVTGVLAPLAALTAAVAVIALAWKTNFLGIQDITREVVSFLEDTLGVFIRWLQEGWSALHDAIGDDVTETLGVVEQRYRAVIDTLQAVLSAFFDVVRELWDAHGETVLSIVEPLFDNLQIVIETTIGNLIEVIQLGLALIRGDWESAGESLENITENITDAIAGIFKNLLEVGGVLWSLVTDGFNAIVDWLTDIGIDDIESAFESIGEGIRSIVLGLFDVGGTLWGIVTGFVGELYDYIASGSAYDDLTSAFGTLIGGITDIWSTAFDMGGTVGDLMKGLVSDMASYIADGGAKDDLVAATKDLIEGILTAWGGLVTGLIGNSIIPDMFDAIADFIVGEGMSLLTGAFGDALGAVKDTVSDLAGDITDTVSGALDVASDGLSEAQSKASDAASAASDAASSASDAASSAGSGVSSGLSSAANRASSTVPGLNSGGVVEESGLAVIHEGEHVYNPAKADKGNPDPPGSTTVGSVDVEEDVERALESADRTDDLLAKFDRLIDVVAELSAGDVSEKEILRALGVAEDRRSGRNPLTQ